MQIVAELEVPHPSEMTQVPHPSETEAPTITKVTPHTTIDALATNDMSVTPPIEIKVTTTV